MAINRAEAAPHAMSLDSGAAPGEQVTSEDELLEEIIAATTGQAEHGVALGIGDDAALLQPTHGRQLVCSTDSLVGGVHFFDHVSAADLGWKSLAVNLSDLAAMGAKPRWATLALTLPTGNRDWLREFLDGFMVLARQSSLALVGGDLCRGPLNINVCALGEVDPAKALRRRQAQADDDIWASGALGGAALAVERIQQGKSVPDNAMTALLRPQPRLGLGQSLAVLASSAMDLPDGLARDLPRLLPPGLGASIETSRLPLHQGLETLSPEQQRDFAIAGGDDYELLFSSGREHREQIRSLSLKLELPLTRIGQVTASAGICWLGQSGEQLQPGRSCFEHFSGSEDASDA